ncbi:MAG: NRDE family protein [Deltaproteobacteria bacterium]|nr:NRDE family protein [Deltaproteobacteria bacterium]
MCLIAIAIKRHPDFPLIIAANRDEFYDRPTAPLGLWEDNSNILAGRDLKEGGTWLGATRIGRIAAVTNFRDFSHVMKSSLSRGELVSKFLDGIDELGTFLNKLRKGRDRYNGFNLLFGDMNRLFWYSNVADRHEILKPGIHIVSNHLLNTPWPKTEKIRKKMDGLLENRDKIEPEEILAMLLDRRRPGDELLPDTGVSLEWERILSPVFVTSEIYGTRSSSVIMVHKNGTLTFIERNYPVPENGPEKPEKYHTRKFEMHISKE